MNMNDALADNHFALQIGRNQDNSGCGSAGSFEKLSFRLTITPHIYLETPLIYDPGKWYFVAGTYYGDKFRIYVYHELVKESESIPGIIFWGNGTMWINNHCYSGTYSPGRIGGISDEIRLYNLALTFERLSEDPDPPILEITQPSWKNHQIGRASWRERV